MPEIARIEERIKGDDRVTGVSISPIAQPKIAGFARQATVIMAGVKVEIRRANEIQAMLVYTSDAMAIASEIQQSWDR